MVLPGTFRLGPLRFPVFGVFATGGLLAALGLSQRTAKRAGVSAEKLWDAGVVGIVLAFLLSRLELVLSNWTAFRAMPVLVLSLPSISYTGILLTFVLVWLYLRWKGVPPLRAMDAWAPCAMVLWAFVSLGHFVEGTDAGMPTSMPWGVVSAGDSVLGKTQPVEIYAVIVAFILLRMSLVAWLKTGWYAGQTAVRVLISASIFAYLIDMFRQPSLEAGLDMSQFIDLLLLTVGFVLMMAVSKPRPELTREEVAAILHRIATGASFHGYEHEAIEYGRFSDPLLLEIREKIPDWLGGPTDPDEANQAMLEYVRRLREESSPVEKRPATAETEV